MKRSWIIRWSDIVLSPSGLEVHQVMPKAQKTQKVQTHRTRGCSHVKDKPRDISKACLAVACRERQRGLMGILWDTKLYLEFTRASPQFTWKFHEIRHLLATELQWLGILVLTHSRNLGSLKGNIAEIWGWWRLRQSVPAVQGIPGVQGTWFRVMFTMRTRRSTRLWHTELVEVRKLDKPGKVRVSSYWVWYFHGSLGSVSIKGGLAWKIVRGVVELRGSHDLPTGTVCATPAGQKSSIKATWPGNLNFTPSARKIMPRTSDASTSQFPKIQYRYIHVYILIYIIYSSARPAPGRKFRKTKNTIGRKWPIGKFLRCKNHEVKLWSAPTNEQMVVEMPMKGDERIYAQLTEWINEPMNRWIRRWINQSTNQSINQSNSQSTNQGNQKSNNAWSSGSTTNESMNQWINESVDQWLSDSTNQWINQPMHQRISEPMNHWIYESVNVWMIACMHAWMIEWMNERTNEWINERAKARMNEWMNERTDEWMNEWRKEGRNEWLNEWIEGWVDGWMNELLFFVRYFFTERPLRRGTLLSATSSPSSRLSGVLLLWPASS